MSFFTFVFALGVWAASSWTERKVCLCVCLESHVKNERLFFERLQRFFFFPSGFFLTCTELQVEFCWNLFIQVPNILQVWLIVDTRVGVESGRSWSIHLLTFMCNPLLLCAASIVRLCHGNRFLRQRLLLHWAKNPPPRWAARDPCLHFNWLQFLLFTEGGGSSDSWIITCPEDGAIVVKRLHVRGRGIWNSPLLAGDAEETAV